MSGREGGIGSIVMEAAPRGELAAVEINQKQHGRAQALWTRVYSYPGKTRDNSSIPLPRTGHTCAIVNAPNNKNISSPMTPGGSKKRELKRVMVLFGGYAGDPLNKSLNDTWELDLDSLEWTKIYEEEEDDEDELGDANNHDHSHPHHHKKCKCCLREEQRQRRRLLQGSSFAPILPEARVGHSAAACPLTGKFYNCSGKHGAGDTDVFDVWVLDTEIGYKWEKLHCKGDVPNPLILHSSTIANDNCMYVLGGCGVEAPFHWTVKDKLYRLNLDTNTWTEIKYKGKFTRRERHCAVVYKNKVVIYGGFDDERYFNDVVVLDLASYVFSSPKCYGEGPKLGLRSHTAVVDNYRHKMIVFGGKDPHKCVDDMYELDLETYRWTKVATNGDRPEVRGRHSCVLDEEQGKMYVCSGTDGLEYYNDLYVCNFGTYAKDISNLFDP